MDANIILKKQHVPYKHETQAEKDAIKIFTKNGVSYVQGTWLCSGTCCLIFCAVVQLCWSMVACIHLQRAS